MRRYQLCRTRVRQWSVLDEEGKVVFSDEYPYLPAAAVVLTDPPEERERRSVECAAYISSSLGQPLDYVRRNLDEELAVMRGVFGLLRLVR